MNNPNQITLLGEVLFDCFDTGIKVLGGAPFNVAWHLHALGDSPVFVSKVGNDQLGDDVVLAMKSWGMDTSGIQRDKDYPTGQVTVEVKDNEPVYTILPDQAYDYVACQQLPAMQEPSILYHGSLALRSTAMQHAYEHYVEHYSPHIFLDVNLRPPWWDINSIEHWLARAKWVKLNEHELAILGYDEEDDISAMRKLMADSSLSQVLLTRGEKGASLLTDAGHLHHVTPTPASVFVDAVGAGDAFTAVYLHGLMKNWDVDKTLQAAQAFASQIVGIRGATTTDSSIYKTINQ